MLVDFFHRLLNPHCPECIVKDEELLHNLSCKSCEMLNKQLERSDQNYKELLNSILHKDNKDEEPTDKKEFKPIRTIGLPWRAKREMLEREDRIKAQIIAREKLNNPVEGIEELEKEMGLAEKERESHA